jgi:hypothetical protein
MHSDTDQGLAIRSTTVQFPPNAISPAEFWAPDIASMAAAWESQAITLGPFL